MRSLDGTLDLQTDFREDFVDDKQEEVENDFLANLA
jgi:hypothetical protein